MEESFVDTSKITLREISKYVAKDMIVKNHYSHKWSLCSHAIGIFYDSDKSESDFVDDKQKLIGCLIYGNPVGRSAAASITDLIKIDEVLELTRLFIHDGYGKNIESYCISKSFEWIRKNRPDIRALISYADVEQNHNGTIYQATGWIYQGNNSLCLMPNFSISLSKDPYNWIHSRTVFETYGSHNIEHLKSVIGHTFYRKKESGKHRYVQFLAKNKIEKKKLIKSLKHPPMEYPKNSNLFKEEIEEYIVDSSQVIQSNEFFG